MLSDEKLIEVYALNCDCEGTRVMLNGLRAVAEAAVKDYEEVLADHRRLVRELDVLLNGAGAARQASLCDIVGQVSKEQIRSRLYISNPAEAAVKAEREGQEPVGYMVMHPSGFKSMVWVDEPDMLELAKSAKFDVTAIYTTPPAAPVPDDVFKSIVSPTILAYIGKADELLVRRIWDDVRRAMLAASKQEAKS